MTDRYAVIGNPISHSKSPLIHQLFGQQTAQAIHYEAIESPLETFPDTIARLRQDGYKGVNVTVPFKLQAWQLADVRSPAALRAEAANTLLFGAAEIVAHNTDGIGLVRDITKNAGVSLENKRLLLLGAGGAAQGVLWPLLEAAPESLVICNRSEEKARNMQATLADHPVFAEKTRVLATAQLAGQGFDIVINATSAGLSGSEMAFPEGVLNTGALAYDMMYGRETPFMRWADGQGARVADGLGMLVEQAAEAFYLWRGIRPDTAPVLAGLRNSK